VSERVACLFSIIGQKHVFWPPFSHMLTNLDDIWQGPATNRLYHAYTCKFNFTPIGAWVGPGRTITTLFFVIPKVYHNSSYIQQILHRRWQTHKCLGGGLCCGETFQKFLTWAQPEPKNGSCSFIEYLIKSCNTVKKIE